MLTQKVSGKRRVDIQKSLEFLRLVSTQGNQLCILHSVTASQAETGVGLIYKREESPFVLELGALLRQDNYFGVNPMLSFLF